MTVQYISKGFLHYFLFNSVAVSLLLLFSVLKPHRLYKKFLSKFLAMKFTFNNGEWRVYNVLLLVIGFYMMLFAFLQLSIEERGVNELPEIRMERLGRKWMIETNIWMTTLVLVCLISVYRNAMLFTEEEGIKKEMEEIDKMIEMVKKVHVEQK